MKKIICLFGMSLLLQGCDPVKFWNGHYSLQASHKEAERERKAYYDKETPEQKRLREINRKLCWKLAEKPENTAKGGHWVINVYEKCMKERGSPLFEWKK